MTQNSTADLDRAIPAATASDCPVLTALRVPPPSFTRSETLDPFQSHKKSIVLQRVTSQHAISPEQPITRFRFAM